MGNWRSVIAKGLTAGLFALAALVPMQANAQSAACTADEDVVTFNFSTTLRISANGTSATWTAGSTNNSYQVATAGTVAANTITLTATPGGAAPFVAPDPSLLTQGNVSTTLSLNMDPAAPTNGVTLTLVFNRPMDKVRFNMYDVDKSNGQWQDVMQVTGYLNGIATPIPTLVPITPANYTTTTFAQSNQITSNTNLNCNVNQNTCNVEINFANPLDRVTVFFLAGPAEAAPSTQRVAFNRFSYCVPKRDLRVTKTSSTATFVAGDTPTYLLTVNNRGGAATTGNTSVTDVISTQGVSFVNPQTPAGWTCSITTGTRLNDTASCFTATSIAAGGTTVLTLTVSISPDASATTVVNRAKVYGGGDPNKILLTSTGPVSSCDAANENQSGGGATFFGGVDTTDAGCSFESTPMIRRASLTVTKTNGNAGTISAGVTTTYTITFANLGPSNAPGSFVVDQAVPGLNCVTPTFVSSPVGTITLSPLPLTLADFQGTGVSFTPTFPRNTTALFTLTCGVTATGVP